MSAESSFKTIAIIGAMQEEITPLLEHFSDYERIEIGGNVYYKITQGTRNIIIAYSKIGKVYASLTCAVMILRFGAECVIFSGVAGGLQNLKVGDMILATSLCQYDVDITAFGHPLGFIPESKIHFDTSERLNKIARLVAQEQGIALKEGIVASGDSFVSNMAKKRWIIQHFNAAAVEMEGASIAVVASELKVPFCVIRSISDSADDEANISFDEFLAVSATKSAKFVLSMIEKM